jgi:hypothetical protein
MARRRRKIVVPQFTETCSLCQAVIPVRDVLHVDGARSRCPHCGGIYPVPASPNWIQLGQPRIPKVGDKVIPRNSQAVYTVWQVSTDGTEVNIEIKGTLVDRYRVPVRDLTWVDEK